VRFDDAADLPLWVDSAVEFKDAVSQYRSQVKHCTYAPLRLDMHQRKIISVHQLAFFIQLHWIAMDCNRLQQHSLLPAPSSHSSSALTL
jgi:hypothetical protein